MTIAARSIKRILILLPILGTKWGRHPKVEPVTKVARVSDEVEIEEIEAVTDELFEAWKTLLPQLSSSAKPMTREWLTRVVEAPDTTMIVARIDQKIIGALTLVTFAIPVGLRARIEDVVVDKSARGQGVGEQLSRYGLDLAARMGSPVVDLTSSPDRESANRLYQRIGFQPRNTNVYRFKFDG